ncbi:MAG: N-acetylneuraminate synthase family protein [Candidatus Buchananbacteria bacterium]
MEIRIGKKVISQNSPAFIIAEAGVNHNGQLFLAKKLVKAAKEAGADAVKFQTWKTENIIVPKTKKADYQKNNTGSGDQFSMLKRLELKYHDFRILSQYAKRIGIIFLSTPDDKESLDFLVDDLKLPILKIGSSEINNHDYLKEIAAKKRPILLSTGMATLQDVILAVKIIKKVQPRVKLVIMQCTTAYPCPFQEVNLNVIFTYRKKFPSALVGFSDHTSDILAPSLAVALGAKVIEKHFTLNNNLPGPDHQASLAVKSFKEMVKSIRLTEKMMGYSDKKISFSERSNREVLQKYIVAKSALHANDKITLDKLGFKRTSQTHGLKPEAVKDILNHRLKINLKKNQIIKIRYVE